MAGGVGIDLLEIERLERALERRPALAERFFTGAERAYAARRARPGQHLAARFCAKEAVAKALALVECSWRDIDFVSLPCDWPPYFFLHDSLSSRAPLSLSLTHTRETAGSVS